MNVVLAKPLGYHAERLKHKNERAVIIDGFLNANRDGKSKIDYRDLLILTTYVIMDTCKYLYRLQIINI